MRKGMQSFRVFKNITLWREYVASYMANAEIVEKEGGLTLVIDSGEIGGFEMNGIGYIEECRSIQRLKKTA